MTGKKKNKPSENPQKLPTHYIGIGASAGGLEALQILLQNLPTDTGACFVIVQHLSPDFKSMMMELLSKYTSMAIHNVVDDMRVQPNKIYLIPPQKNMMVAEGRLLLSDKIPDAGLNLPIDIFFRSLSEDQQHKAIGIILSGTGSDGSRGIKALKEAGALVIAQDPESAKFDGMPNSAINTGIIDLILRPEAMGEKIEAYIRHPLVSGDTTPLKDSMTGDEDIMAEIFNVLKMKSEIDFAKYKPSTVARRIERRMTIKQVTSLQEYLTLLYKEPYEVQVLSRELLIGVTRFFRDDETFKTIEEHIIPDIVKKSSEEAPIRVWVAACSSGEEAYSVAMLFYEELARQQLARTIKVFATDVNGDAISEASNGFYSEDIVHDVGAHLISTHFTKTAGNSYQVNKNIRQMVVFATHNMIIDPPFSNMDLVTCRNVLIYFQHSVQKRVLTSLHFALRKDGYLFLGSSENLGDLAPHFEVVNERGRIYRKRSSVRIPIGSAPPVSTVSQSPTQSIPSVGRLMRNYRGTNAAGSAISFANDALITHYAPPCILLNDEHEALHVYGDVTPYVRRLPPGRISTDVKDMVNDDISIAVSSALHRAKESQQEVYYTDVFTQTTSANPIGINLRVHYMKEHEIDTSPGYYWVIFERPENADAPQVVKSVSFDASEQARQRIEDLELELKRNKENLQVTVEELETTNEELQSANEELMSANEELQSTNEELQSVNEELYTVNSEFQEKIAEISQANSDLDEVLSLSRIGIIFLDENMLIRRYTQAASAYVNLMETDINRPLHHISKNIKYDNMLGDVSTVFTSGKPQEHEVTMADKRVLRISINPYSYDDISLSKGVAITFSDISKVKYTEMGMAVAYKQLRNSINNVLETLDTKTLGKKLAVLIVDDSPAELDLMEHQLLKISDFDITLYKASTVVDACNHIEHYKIDICIADYHLNGETALDLIEALAQQAPDIPTIVVTGDVADDLGAMLLSHGALDLIEKKDVFPLLLAKSIRFALRRKQIDRQIEQLIPDDKTTETAELAQEA
ncbi:MAG: PAS domain-containing protein [Cellvibrionaceae bacterium]|nr:PAS domain-containing protein [Cellvibrionaceae bacterium]